MINGPELLADLKESTSTKNFDNIPDELYYKWLSRSHSTIVEYLKAKIDSKFFMGISQADVIAGQTLYDNVGLDATTGLYINVIDAIYLKYDGLKFKKVRIADLTELPESREYYEQNQTEENPFCTITGQKVIFYPTPKIDSTNGIEIIGSRNVNNIDADTVQANLYNGKIQETNYIELITKGAEQYVYNHISETTKEQKVRQEFLYEDLPAMKTELSFRGSQPLDYQECDLSHLLQ